MHLNTFEHEMKKKTNTQNKTKYSTAHSTQHIRHDNEFYSYGERAMRLFLSFYLRSLLFRSIFTARFSVFILNIAEPLRWTIIAEWWMNNNQALTFHDYYDI